MNTAPRNPEQDATVLDNQVMQDTKEITNTPNAQQELPANQPEVDGGVEDPDATQPADVTPAQPVKKQPEWVMPTAAAGAGIVMGAGGMLMINACTQHANAADLKTLTLAELMTDGNVDVAHNVTDDMTFAEAFAAARSEVGAGGVFSWRGNVYSTFTDGEWNALSLDDQNDYLNHFNWNGADSMHRNANGEMDDVPVDNPIVTTVATGHDVESGADYAVVSINNQEALLVDIDADGTMDYMAADVNEDGQLTPEEIMDLQQEGVIISADDLACFGYAEVAMDA